jgi:hypothetical protein
MNPAYLAFFLLLFVVFLLAAKRQSPRQAFTQDTTFVLLGDSVLNNGNYVEPGESVAETLTDMGRYHVRNYALDNATIATTLAQVDNVPEETKKGARVFLSAGGNDLLHMPRITEQKVTKLFDQYVLLVQAVLAKFPNAEGVFLLNVYLPPGPQFEEFAKPVKQWNALLAGMTCCPVVDVHAVMTTANDFTHKIEPSAAGGKLIVGAILEARKPI